MNYAIRMLQMELRSLEKTQSTWKDGTMQAGKKVHEQKIKDVTKAIELIQNQY